MFNPSDVEAHGPRDLGEMGLCPWMFSSVFVPSSDQVAASSQTLFYSTLSFLLPVTLCSIILWILCYMSVIQCLSLTYTHTFLLLYYPSLTEPGFRYLMPWVFTPLTFQFVDFPTISPVLHSHSIAPSPSWGSSATGSGKITTSLLSVMAKSSCPPTPHLCFSKIAPPYHKLNSHMLSLSLWPLALHQVSRHQITSLSWFTGHFFQPSSHDQ